MGLADLIRKQVQGTADKLTKGLQVNVTFQAWVGQTGDGTDDFADPVLLPMIVDRSQRASYGDGIVLQIDCTLLALKPIPPTSANSGQTRVNPVDPRDKFTLPDGFSSPIVKVGGFMDAGFASTPFYNEITLGYSRSR